MTSSHHNFAILLAVWIAAAAGCAGSFPPAGTIAPFSPATPLSSGPGTEAAERSMQATVRGQTPPLNSPLENGTTPGGTQHWRFPMRASGAPVSRGQNAPGIATVQPATPRPYRPETYTAPPTGSGFPGVVDPGSVVSPVVDGLQAGPPAVDFDVFVEEARTGRFMFGVGVNSDLGLTGQIVIDERNFDWRNVPTSWQDVMNGTAWRGGGQGFRLEAIPGTEVQRYVGSWTQPYLYVPGLTDPVSLSLSGSYYDRYYFDWTEGRVGGRVGLGYRLRPDLSLSTSIRAENVNMSDPRTAPGVVPELDAVLGDSALYSGRVTVTHDTRDTAFDPTQGHLIELGYEQVFGSFDYPRADFDYRQYFLIRERPDSSGRHTLSYSFRLGFSGSQTPLFENYFAGGFSTLRGFDFRGASPTSGPPSNVDLGGQFRFLGSVEYTMPLTADDMLKAVAFCDFGTVEESIKIHGEDYRVAPGVGLRIAIPAMGPAPLALDLAFPIAKSEFDEVQNFSFFLGFTR